MPGYQMANISIVDTLVGHNDRVWSVAWNPSGNVLASCGADKTIRLWSEESEGSWKCLTVLDGAHQRTIRYLSWSPCGQLLAAASFDGTTSIWSKKSGDFECIATLEGHENEVKCVGWSTNGVYLATCSRDKSVWIFEVDDEGENFDCASVLHSHSQDVKCVRWNPVHEILSAVCFISNLAEVQMLASAGYDDTIKLYCEEGDDWSCFATLESHSSTVWSVDFDATGDRLVSCSDDRTLKVWKSYPPGNPQGVQTKGKHATWKCVCTMSGHHARPIYDVQWCKLTGLVASACGDDSIRIFSESSASSDSDQPSFDLIASAKTFEVNGLCWNPQRRGLLASCSDNGDVQLWTVSNVENA